MLSISATSQRALQPPSKIRYSPYKDKRDLYHIPWDSSLYALHSGKNFMVEDYDLFYLPSASVLKFVFGKKKG